MEFNWHAILLQALCVAEPVVAQGVGSGYLDDGSWEAGEGLSEERGYFGVRCGAWLVRLCISTNTATCDKLGYSWASAVKRMHTKR